MPFFNRSRRGFSLIEMMVVIAIVGVIAGISGPPIFRYINSNRLQTDADRLGADLQYARTLSISTSTILRFTSTQAGYQLTDPITGTIIRDKVFENGMQLAADQTADFFPWGMADATVFNISNNTGAMTVNLLPTGIVEVN
ncbi:MAG: prepilin-type N-terminal cleavage/methylation domain-containing protein [Candidatus Krumholzibacteria bacterium]|nr:prepilin-type N-terminal cleavage/methylation domain-containing protein [Candidatus Krumholzibacteria bacterium]